MEEVSAQVAHHPIFMHHQPFPNHRFGEASPPPTMAKKRDLPTFHQQKYPKYQQQQHQHQHQPRGGFQNQNPSMGTWNPNLWDWDSVRFVAKPLQSSNIMDLGTSTTTATTTILPPTDQKRKDDAFLNKKNSTVSVADETLSLKLGGGGSSSSSDGLTTAVEEPLSTSNKRIRSGSPGSTSYPMCQVDNCREDLSDAKDYHRRHKVCEIHSKSTKALVGKVMQRFCQQCSRFHPLSEFDEGKRSCRRRLAGHNRRRRKTQPDDVTSRLLVPGNRDNPSSGNLDIVNLLSVLACAQGNNEDKNANTTASVPGRNQLIQILSKINSLPLPADFAAQLPIPESLSSSFQQQASSEQKNKLNGNASSPSTMDLLTVLSTSLAESAPDSLAVLSQSSTQSSDGEKTKLACQDQPSGLISRYGPNLDFSSVRERSSTSYQSPVEDSDCLIQETRVNIPLQLFSSSPETDSPPKLASASKYFSSDSSSPMDDGSPSSSPVVQLFPVQTSKETMKPERICRDGNAGAEVSRTRGCITSLELFGGSTRGADIGSFQSSPYQAGYSSSSGSDRSPSSFGSDAQDRTGRIIFKLFDKDPSQIPGALRTQIFNWLSNSPSDMESYIRPGCVVLSIYVSLSPDCWQQLEENFLLRVISLVQDIDSDFWRNGRFLVHTGRQLASHRNGKIRLCKTWKTWKAPELILVTPLAVVTGIETHFILRGRNLTNPGTKIHCTYMGGYTSKEAAGPTTLGTTYDEISFGSLKFDGASSSAFGRCFIEVENGFKGNSFPVIIADAPICQELRLLESELDEETKMYDVTSEDLNHHNGFPRSREEVLHFLNELGWLFQRRERMSSMLNIPDYSLARFKYLLAFSVERDYCALVKELLDILVKGNIDKDHLSLQSMEMLSEVQLLNRAVKKRCRKMVELLLNFSIISTDETKRYIFPPNMLGPGGVTPLHLAACTSGSDDMVDCLTNDPLKIGLNCWSSLLDLNGQSPYTYAMLRNNHSYNRLVAQKLADRRNGQVSVLIGNEMDEPWTRIEHDDRTIAQLKRGSGSCTKCAVVAAKYHRRISGTQGLFHRPYIHSMLAIAAVCVCVCIFFRGSPCTGLVAPFKWENLDFGTS